ncbi:MAG: DUF3106 domain-containing protein [Nitrosomonadales bacterium]|nr:DUF3106 domain-containing protein [Nitrosomonadales bacterium]
MNTVLNALVSAGIAAAFSFNAIAADAAAGQNGGVREQAERAEMRRKMQDHWKGMSPEERRAMRETVIEDARNMPAGERALARREMREKMKERRENLPPGERAERRKEMRERFEGMSPEERGEMREKMRKRWESLPPEERAERRKEMRERFEKMSPEEREQFRRDMGRRDGMPPPLAGRPGVKPEDAR